jgi:tRNA(fMet)-specific endonuclease VapC
LTAIAKAKSVKEQIDRYRELNRMLRLYCSMNVLDYDERAAIEFQQLRKSKLRMGTMDMKIAAIALAYDAILLTRNAGDFLRVPGLKLEDWTKE